MALEMSAPDLPGRNDLPDDFLISILAYCTDAGDDGVSPAGAEPEDFRWYAQDTGDEVADEVLAWASMDETDCDIAVGSAHER
jgi:hypothetical protein